MKEKKQIHKLSYSTSGKAFRGLLCMLTFCAFVVGMVFSFYAIDTYGDEIIRNPKRDFRETSIYQEDIENEITNLLNQVRKAYLDDYADGLVTVIDAYSNKAYDYDLGEIKADSLQGSFTAKNLEDLDSYIYKTNTEKAKNFTINNYYNAKSYITGNAAEKDFLYLDTAAFRNLFVEDGYRNKNHCFSDDFSENAYFVFDCLGDNLDYSDEAEVVEEQAGLVSENETATTESMILPDGEETEININISNNEVAAAKESVMLNYNVSSKEYAVYDPEQEVFYSTWDEYFEPMECYIYAISELKDYLQNLDPYGQRYNSLIIPMLHSYNYPIAEMFYNPLEQYDIMIQAKSFLTEYDTLGGFYYVELEDNIYTNVEELSEIQGRADWYYLRKASDGSADLYLENTENQQPILNETAFEDELVFFPDDIKVYFAIEPGNQVESERLIVRHFQEYSFYASYAFAFFVMMVAAFILTVFQAFWLIWTTGRDHKGSKEIVLNRFDSMPTEIWAVICGVVLVINVLLVCINPGSIISFDGNIIRVCVGVLAITLPFAFCFMILTLSFARRIKAHNLWTRSLLYRGIRREKEKESKNLNEGETASKKNILVRIWNGMVRALKTGWKKFRGLKGTYKLMAVFMINVIVCTFCLISVYRHSMYDSSAIQWTWLIYIITQFAALFIVLYIIKDTNRMIHGVKEITKGNLDYKVEVNEKISLYKELSEGINHIGDGLKAAVETSLKDERMKTELITNVSHDLKTPLTSIINYINLLKTEKMPTPEAEHYVEVLDSKAWRLRQLTEDLVEAAKATSGNIELEMMPLAFDELMKQALGEFEDKFAEKDLTVISHYPEAPAVVMADGRRMFRIIENVLQNAYKYALPGTRIYADLSNIDGTVTFTLKNISAAPLNIGADELMERFTRGDSARTTEGSGLGLSIAKDLTRLQEGTFEIVLDGDLFKVIIQFSELKK